MAIGAVQDDGTRALMVRNFPIDVLESMHAAAKARRMSMREYIAALFELHEQARELANRGGEFEPIQEMLCKLGLQSITV